jgi:hypothetical protein
LAIERLAIENLAIESNDANRAAKDVAIERADLPRAFAEFSGAPLDLIKTIAAGLMVVDHVNYMFFGHVANAMWYFGRSVFPLFAFALVCNLMRGTNIAGYVRRLILLAVVSQPLYATAIGVSVGDVLFTLAAGAVVAVALRAQNWLVQHGVFLIATVLIFTSLLQVRDGLDYGLAGMLLPAALYLVLAGNWSHMPWLGALVAGLNWYPDIPWRFGPWQVACVAAGMAILVALVSLALKGRPRFLPRYALHVFYPGHLAVLIAIHHYV